MRFAGFISKNIRSRLLSRLQGSFFLLGPRGTGKSTWLRSEYPEARRFDLLDEALFQRFLVNPGAFAGELRRLPEGARVILDEVQRLPGLLNEVHRFIEERGQVFALCGSSASKLKRAGVNLLAGRAVHRAMHPFVPRELGADFDLERSLRCGLLPIVWESESPDDTLSAYARMYLKEEIQAEALVRNLPGFARFLPIAALGHGQVLNPSNIARDAGIARTTVAGYLEILEETLLAFRVPAHETRLRVRERAHPKFYFCDPGLARALKGSKGDLLPEERGVLFEGLVAQVLRSYRDYCGAVDSIHFWSSGAGLEIDFLVTRGGRWAAIEVKSGSHPRPDWFRGLRALRGMPGLHRRVVVHPDNPCEALEDGIEILDFATFEEELAKGSFLRPAAEET